MNVIEIAVYAMVLTASQPKPFECVAVQPEGVNCTNGLSALPQKADIIAFNNGIKVVKDKSGRVQLSDGTTTFFDSSAWVSFVNKAGETFVSARRTARTRFKFSNGFTCEGLPDPDMARCYK